MSARFCETSVCVPLAERGANNRRREKASVRLIMLVRGEGCRHLEGYFGLHAFQLSTVRRRLSCASCLPGAQVSMVCQTSISECSVDLWSLPYPPIDQRCPQGWHSELCYGVSLGEVECATLFTYGSVRLG